MMKKFFVLDNAPWSVEDRHYVLRRIFGPCYVQVAYIQRPKEQESRVAVSVPEHVEAREAFLSEYDMGICYEGKHFPMRGIGFADFVKTSQEARNV